GSDSIVSDLSSIANTDKCVDTSDLLLNYAHVVNAMRQHHDHQKRVGHHGKKSLKRPLAADDFGGSQGSDDTSRKDPRGSEDSQTIDEGVAPRELQDQLGEPEGE
ncbi:unnamed protein product, partial [Lymnaea stagnalis]